MPFCSPAVFTYSQCLILIPIVRYFSAKICAIFYLSSDMDGIVLVGAGTAIVGVFVFVFGGAGLVGYFPSFFLSIIY